MNAFVVFFAVLGVASAGWIGHGYGHGYGHGAWNPAAHIASGSVSVGHNGAVVAGPAGSVATDNGLHGHGAGARLSGPAGDVRTHGGAVTLHGPGNGHDGGWAGDGDDGQWHGDGAWGAGAWGAGGWGGHGGWDGEDDGQWHGDHGAWDGDDGQWHGDHGAWGHGHGHGW